MMSSIHEIVSLTKHFRDDILFSKYPVMNKKFEIYKEKIDGVSIGIIIRNSAISSEILKNKQECFNFSIKTLESVI